MYHEYPNRVANSADTVAVKLIRERGGHLSASVDRAAKDGIYVVDIDQEAQRTSTYGLRAKRAHLRAFIGKHYCRIADLDLGVADSASGGRHTKQLSGAKRRLIKLYRICRAFTVKVGRKRMVSFRDGFDFARHRASPFILSLWESARANQWVFALA
jgi:hypothetical protein